MKKCKQKDCTILLTKNNKSGFCCYHYNLNWKRKQKENGKNPNK